VGIATVVVLVSLGYGLQGILLGRLITTPESLVTIEASYPSDSDLLITQATVSSTSALPLVKEVSPVAEFPGAVMSQGSSGLVLVDVADANYFKLSGDLPDIGQGFGQSGGAVISNQALRLINLPASVSTLGKMVSVTVFYTSADGTSTYVVTSTTAMPITGIVVNNAESPTIMVSNTAFKQAPPYFKEIYAEATSEAELGNLRGKLTGQGFLISAHIDLVQQAQQVTNIITIILGIFGVAALIVSAIGMFNTMIVGFLERTYEVGVMKAIGATDGDVRSLFLMESLIMGLAGGVIGIAIGVGIGELLNILISLLAEHYGGTGFTLFVSPIWFLGLVVGFSAVIGLLAGFIPARRASSLSPKEAFVRK